MRILGFAILVLILAPQAGACQQPPQQAQVDTLIARSRKTINIDVDRGDSLVQAALTLAQQIGYGRGEAYAHAQHGLAEFYRGNNKEAVKAYLQALRIYEKNKLPTDLTYGLIMVRLAAIFHSEQDWAQNRYYLKKALAAAEEIGDQRLMGLAHLEMADAYTSLQHFDSAFYFYDAALQQFNRTGDRLNQASVYGNMGINHFYMGQYQRAIDYYKKGLVLNRQIGRVMQTSHALYNIGEAYYALGNYEPVITYMDSAYATAAGAGQYGGVSDIYLLKARAFSRLKKTDSASHYFEKLIALKDSVYSDTYKKERATMQATLDVYKHESENNLLKKDNRIATLYRNLAIAGAVALIFILAFVLTRQRLKIQKGIKTRLEEEVRQRTAELVTANQAVSAKNNELAQINEAKTQLLAAIEEVNLKLQLSLNRAKVDPHFIFNVLNSIQHIVLEKKPHEALDHLGKLSRLMRYVLEKSSLEIVTVQEEITMLEQYIQLEQLRLDDKFQYHIESRITDPVKVPAMLIQPYVENAILHGLSPAPGSGLLLKLVVEKAGDFLRIVIEDNGVGRKPGARHGHQSMGSSLGQKRLDILSKLEQKLFSLTIEDLVRNDTPMGTKVTLQIPLTQTTP
jgi:tetratricopeptide (TPR) repeat protein